MSAPQATLTKHGQFSTYLGALVITAPPGGPQRIRIFAVTMSGKIAAGGIYDFAQAFIRINGRDLNGQIYEAARRVPVVVGKECFVSMHIPFEGGMPFGEFAEDGNIGVGHVPPGDLGLTEVNGQVQVTGQINPEAPAGGPGPAGNPTALTVSYAFEEI